jgi:ribosome-binding protein aMBF1 (putative translation factor)
MIKTEKQYQVLQKKFADLKEQIKAIRKDTKQDPFRKEDILLALQMKKNEVGQQLLIYETSQKRNEEIVKDQPLADLPAILTEYKIKNGLTQKEFAEKLGLKVQRLQRYEADNFKSVTLNNLLRFLDLTGIEIRIIEIGMSGVNKKPVKKKA